MNLCLSLKYLGVLKSCFWRMLVFIILWPVSLSLLRKRLFITTMLHLCFQDDVCSFSPHSISIHPKKLSHWSHLFSLLGFLHLASWRILWLFLSLLNLPVQGEDHVLVCSQQFHMLPIFKLWTWWWFLITWLYFNHHTFLCGVHWSFSSKCLRTPQSSCKLQTESTNYWGKFWKKLAALHI